MFFQAVQINYGVRNLLATLPVAIKTKMKASLPADSALASMSSDIAEALGCAHVQWGGPISVRNNSTVYIIHPSTGLPDSAILKCCRDPVTGQIDNVSANRQFQALSRTQSALARMGSAQDVPLPLLLLPAAGAYLMSRVEGEPLTACLHRRWELAALVDVCERAGQWLARFHAAGPLRTGAADIASKLILIDEMKQLPVRHPVFELALRDLASSTTMASLKLNISWLHGDCKADNLLISRGRVVGIDIDLRYENSVEHDLAQFMNHLDLVLMRYRLVHLRRSASILQDSFMLGYQKSGISISMEFLKWLRIWSALASWHARRTGNSTRWYERLITDRNFSSLTHRIQVPKSRV